MLPFFSPLGNTVGYTVSFYVNPLWCSHNDQLPNDAFFRTYLLVKLRLAVFTGLHPSHRIWPRPGQWIISQEFKSGVETMKMVMGAKISNGLQISAILIPVLLRPSLGLLWIPWVTSYPSSKSCFLLCFYYLRSNDSNWLLNKQTPSFRALNGVIHPGCMKMIHWCAEVILGFLLIFFFLTIYVVNMFYSEHSI